MSDEVTPTPTAAPAKPGYKTSEFWMKIAAMLLSTLFASGVIPVGGTAERIAAIAAMMLGALGYTVSRSMVKAAGVLLLIGLAASTQVACSNSGARVKNAGGALLGCELPLAVQTALQLKAPLLEALQGALSGDGLHVDKAKLRAIAAPLWAPELRCALEAAIAYARTPVATSPDAPQSAAFAADPKALGDAWSAVRGELAWPAVQ